MRVFLFAFAVFFLSLSGRISATSDRKDADTLVKLADKGRAPQGTFSFHVEVEDEEDGASISKTSYKVYSKNDVLTLVETISPERLRGRKVLMHSNDLWLYLPSIKRPTRISCNH